MEEGRRPKVCLLIRNGIVKSNLGVLISVMLDPRLAMVFQLKTVVLSQ